MTNAAAKLVKIRADDQELVRKRLAQLRDQIRKLADELHGRRAALGASKADWLQAERETALSHIASIEENGGDFRITAAVPDIDPNRLVVDALPDSIVVEGEPAQGVPTRRYSEFPLDAKINPSRVQAEVRNGYLTIVAPKVETAERDVPKAASAAPSAGCSGKCAQCAR